MLYYSITPIDISSRKSFYFLPMSFSFRPGSEDNKQNYADVPVGYRLSYWCIGYIEKIGGGHHRHYEFFIWMLRRLNYRAVWATLLTASYMDSSIAATATNQPSIRTSARFLLNRILNANAYYSNPIHWRTGMVVDLSSNHGYVYINLIHNHRI